MGMARCQKGIKNKLVEEFQDFRIINNEFIAKIFRIEAPSGFF